MMSSLSPEGENVSFKEYDFLSEKRYHDGHRCLGNEKGFLQ